jgi:hypothetical protein
MLDYLQGTETETDLIQMGMDLYFIWFTSSRVSMDGNSLERENTDGNGLENVKSKYNKND